MRSRRRISRAASAPWRGAKALTRMIFNRWSSVGWRLFGGRRRGLDLSLVGDGSGASVVMAPLLWLGRNFPEAPPALWEIEEGQEVPVTDHDFLRILARPNPGYSLATLWSATLIDWITRGDAYWLIVRDKGGAIRELWWAPSITMDPKGDAETFITHYEYQPGDGQTHRLDPSDVVHFRYGIDPDDVRRGRSPLASVLAEVLTDEEAQAFTAAILKNGGVPGVVISPEGDERPGEDDVKATKAYVDSEFTGDGRGGALVMSGPTRVQQFGFSPEQLNLRALRRIPEERVTAVIGVPAIVCGLGAGLDRSTFANYAEAREAAYEDCVIPAQRLLADELRHQLFAQFLSSPEEIWRYRVGFDLSNVRVLKEDELKAVQRLDIAIRGGWARVAEGRRAIGLETSAADEVYLRPLAALEVPAGDAGRTLEEAPASTGSTAIAAAAGADLKEAKVGTAGQRRLIAAFERDRAVLVATMGEGLEAIFTEAGDRAAEAYAEGAPKGGRNGRTKDADDDLAKQIAEAIGEWMGPKLRAAFEIHYRRTGDLTLEAINGVFDLEVEIPDEAMVAMIAAGGTRAGLLDVKAETRGAILREIADGREAGDGPIEIARRIRAAVPAGRYVNAGPKYRAELIARTETLTAQRASSMAAYRAAPEINEVIAFDGRLGDTDSVCEARNGRTYSIEEAEREAASGDTHPNCTLSFAPVVQAPAQAAVAR